MITISRSVALADDEIVLSGIRAQGAGGQHVNKASTAIHLRFDIKASSLALIKELTAVQKSRRETRPTRASKERRLASKAQKSSVKALRGKVRQ